MVNPGNSAHRHQACSKADPTRPHHRMVTLAQSSPGDRSALTHQCKTTAVMLEREWRVANGAEPYSPFATYYSPRSHRPVGQHSGRRIDAELDLADRADDVIAEDLSKAGIAPIVHVKTVGDDEIV